MNLNEVEDALQQINGQLMTQREMQYVYHVSFHLHCKPCSVFRDLVLSKRMNHRTALTIHNHHCFAFGPPGSGSAWPPTNQRAALQRRGGLVRESNTSRVSSTFRICPVQSAAKLSHFVIS